jgi:hypothetical protein
MAAVNAAYLIDEDLLLVHREIGKETLIFDEFTYAKAIANRVNRVEFILLQEGASPTMTRPVSSPSIQRPMTAVARTTRAYEDEEGTDDTLRRTNSEGRLCQLEYMLTVKCPSGPHERCAGCALVYFASGQQRFSKVYSPLFSCTAKVCVMQSGAVVLTGGDENPTQTLLVSPITGDTIVLPSMHQGRWTHGVCSVGDALMVVGGYNGSTYLNSVEMFSLGSWEVLAPIFIERSAPAVCSIGSVVYVCGGYNEVDGYLSLIEVYEHGVWQIHSIELPTCGASVGVFPLSDHELLILGGLGFDEISNSKCWKLDIVEGEQETLSSLPVPDEFTCSSMLQLKNRLVLMGSRLLWEYDTVYDTWNYSEYPS